MFGGSCMRSRRSARSNEMYIYDMKTGDWSLTIPSSISPRDSYASVLKDDTIIYTGGSDGRIWYNNMCIYNITLNTWTITMDEISYTYRAGHISWLFQDKIYVSCGWNGKHVLNDTWVYDKEWKILNTYNDPLPRDSSSCILIDNILYMVGGGYRKEIYNHFYKLNMITNTWSLISTNPIYGLVSSSLQYSNNILYIIGGSRKGESANTHIISIDIKNHSILYTINTHLEYGYGTVSSFLDDRYLYVIGGYTRYMYLDIYEYIRDRKYTYAYDITIKCLE